MFTELFLYSLLQSLNLLQPQLPQPPTSWRAEAQKIQSLPNNLPCMPPTQYLPNTPLSVVGNTVMPLSTTQQIVPQYQHKEPVSIAFHYLRNLNIMSLLMYSIRSY